VGDLHSGSPTESETLVALGDAPVVPDEAQASAEGATDGEGAPQPATSDSAEATSAEAARELTAEGEGQQTAATPEATPMIEVWRTGRQQFQRRPERQKRPPRVFNITPRPQKEGDGNDTQRFRRERRQDQQKPGLAEPASAVGAERGAQSADDRPPFKNKDERRRPNRHEDHRSARPASFSTETRSRDRAPDPDSPFAKLAALKAELEKNKKG
jgi:ATP-dependent RNA helicase SUPV3L1/SUV3